MTATKTIEEFKLEVYRLSENKFTVLGEYINSATKIRMINNNCGHEFEIRPTNFLTKKGNIKCKECNKINVKTSGKPRKVNTSGQKIHTHDYFVNRVYELTSNEYTVLGNYTKSNEKLLMKHNVCGHTYKVRPNDFISRGSRCPHCKESKGEKKISKWLDLHNIYYIAQYKFNDCRNKKMLPFDFAIFNNKGKLILLIEYDGEQHFEPIKHFGGEKRFKLGKIKDEIKNTYCKGNNIPLLRIPYTQFNHIDKILDIEINKLLKECVV